MVEATRTFFATTRTAAGRPLLQTDKSANLLIDVLRHYVAMRKFELHGFVVMPNHLHLLITVRGEMTIEKAMQLIKGGFSYRIKRELGSVGEVWQHGFSEERVRDAQAMAAFREYIRQNPLKRALVQAPEEYPYCYSYLAARKAHRG